MLSAEAEAVRADFPDLAVSPIHADFTGEVELPLHVRRRGPLAFFPGSTIGNFTPRDAHGFLQRIRRSVGPGGLLLIGADRKKEVEVLLAAYDDAKGVTAAFNLNLLHRINRELDGTFDPGGFAHEARYDEDHGRIEMHLVSQKEQSATVGRHRFSFARGESIHTENSYKYAPSEFALLGRTAGWELVRMWSDPNARFGVYLLRAG
jgi:dimethylhistidine N-methyltransferase